MSIFIVGATGMLGWDLGKTFPEARTLTRSELDVTNESTVRSFFRTQTPEVVINASAYTNVDGAETDRDLALAVNGEGVARLAKFCAETGAKLVHFGTDQVFDGKTWTPRGENDAPSPANYYAETKLVGERAALALPDALVLRVQWLYGDRKDRFTALKHKTVFTPFEDQYGSPTWTRPLAEMVRNLLERRAIGLYHFAYDDYASWADVFAFVKEQWGLTVRLEPKLTEQARLPAERPKFSVMSNEKLSRFLGVPGLGSWREPLRQFLQKRLKDGE